MAHVKALPRLVKEAEAAQILGIEAGTIRNWRVRGTGPAFHKMPGLRGAVRYDVNDLEEWLLQCRHVPSARAFAKAELRGNL